MCRLMCYVGPPLLVADVVLWPERSIIKQSYDAQERRDDSTLPMHLARGNLNGDGFGIGWFCKEPAADNHEPSPCVFTSVTPAWNNENLGRLSRKIVSPLVFAHVRAAYPGMPVSEQNCHPFQWGNYMWMHNGVVGGFMRMRRQLLATLSDAAYNTVQSFHSDSAVAFALFLNNLPSLTERQTPQVMMQAMQGAIQTILAEQRKAGIDKELSLLNFCVSDGHTLVACRFVWPPEEAAASMYYSEGTRFQRVKNTILSDIASSNCARSSSVKDEGEYVVVPCVRGPQCVLIASEPITNSRSDWVEAPKNHFLVVSNEKQDYLNLLITPVQTDVQSDGKADGKLQLMQQPLLAPAGSVRLDAIAAAATANARPWSAGRLPGQTDNQRPPLAGFARPPVGKSHALLSGHSLLSLVAEQCLTGHKGSVMCLQLNGNTLYSGGFDGAIKVWDVQDCRCLSTVPAHVKPVRQMTLAHNMLYSTACQKTRVWDLHNMHCVRMIQAHRRTGHQWALAVGPDGAIYLAGQDMRVKMYKCKFDGQLHPPVSPREARMPEHRLRDIAEAEVPDAVSGADIPHCCAINALAVCGEYVCSAGADAVIHVWQRTNLQHVRALHGHRGSVLALCSLGSLLLSGGRDNVVRVWDMDGLVCRRTLAGHKNDVLCISSIVHSLGVESTGSVNHVIVPRAGSQVAAESPLWSLVASSSADGSVRVWSTACWSCIAILTAQAGPSASPAGAPLGGLVSPPSVVVPTRNPPAMLAVAISEDFVVAGSADSNIYLWSAEAVCSKMKQVSQSLGTASSLDRAGSSEDESAFALAAGGEGNGDATEGTSVAEEDANGVPHKRLKLTTYDSSASLLDGIQRLDSKLGSAPKAGGKQPCNLALRVDRELERSLRELVRIRSVSVDPGSREESFKAAKYLARLMESLGAEMKMAHIADDKNPLVLGRLGRDPSKATVTFYGHYDVQPAMESGWRSNPFEVAAVDGYLYGRGTSDNKGPILAFLYAVKELQEELGGALPCNVAFVFEGEEENGSSGFHTTMQQHAAWFEGTKLILISNTTWVGENVPCLTYGMRGMIALSIEVCGPQRDLHSGNEGGVFNEPLSDLTKVLASLVDSHNNIMVPHFYEDVRRHMLDAALRRLEQHSQEFSLEGYKGALGVEALTAGRNVRDLLEARWCSPALSVVDVRVGEALANESSHTSCYRFGPTRFSVIPAKAVGKVSIRFVPDQKAERLIDCLRSHVEHEFAKLRSCNTVRVEVHNIGEWWQADPDSKTAVLAQKVIEQEWGCAPLLVREGGTMPVASAMERLFGAPAMLFPMGQASDNYHLANERIRRSNLIKGKNVVKRLLVELPGML